MSHRGPDMGGENRGGSAMTVMSVVLILGILIGAVKLLAWWTTGSRALLSDALESVVNVLTGTTALFSLRLAARPPDKSHPYGHGRVEIFSAAFAGVMILMAAAGILRETLPHLWNPQPLTRIGTGAALAGTTVILNAGAGLLLIRLGRKRRSLTLVGEGRHLLADVFTTAGVILGLLLVRLTGWLMLDTVVAIAVALSVAWSGLSLLREAGDRLMDRSDPELIRRLSRVLERLRRPERIDVHLLRCWTSGDLAHIDFHLSLPRYWDLEQVHAAEQELSRELILGLEQPAEVMIHADPCTEELCSRCQVEPCPVRARPAGPPLPWRPDSLVSARRGDVEDACVAQQREASREALQSRFDRGAGATPERRG